MTSTRIIISMQRTWTVVAFTVFQVYLIVAEPELVFNLMKYDLYKYTGDQFFVTCAPEDIDKSTVIGMQWVQPNGDPIILNTGRVRVEKGINGGTDLVFEKAETKDKGEYTCVATVDGVQLSKTFKLHVIIPISFNETKRIQSAEENTNHTVSCSVNGDPLPSINWKSSAHDLKDPRYKQIPDGLIIHNVRRSDAGDYVCRALQMSQETSFNEIVISLRIKYKPEWCKSFLEDEKAFGFSGGITNLTCKAHGEPQPVFTWHKNGSQVSDSNANMTIFSDSNHSVLQIYITGDNDFGSYQCKVSNDLGSIERLIRLEKAEKPAAPELQVKYKGHNKVEFELRPSKVGGLEVIGYRVQYRLHKDTWENANTVDLSEGRMVVLKDLEHNETYLVRVQARNIAGFGDKSQDIQVQTSPKQDHLVSSKSCGRYGGDVRTSLLPIFVLALARLVLHLYIV